MWLEYAEADTYAPTRLISTYHSVPAVPVLHYLLLHPSIFSIEFPFRAKSACFYIMPAAQRIIIFRQLRWADLSFNAKPGAVYSLSDVEV